jgi:hypothetical protein
MKVRVESLCRLAYTVRLRGWMQPRLRVHRRPPSTSQVRDLFCIQSRMADVYGISAV